MAPEDGGDDLAMTGVLVDLDLDDVSPPEMDFRAGSVGETGADIWVMDTSDPVLLHIDTNRVPPAVTEYLLPMTIESPGDANRFVHADGDGCWISSRHDIFRCDRSDDGAIAVERRCIEGGAVVVDRGTVFVLGRTGAAAHLDRRYGIVRVEPATHPVRELDDDGRLIPVEDPATLARVRSVQLAQRARRPAPGQWWSQAGNRLVLASPDMTSVSVDLSVRERGQVEWVQTDPFDDPRILEVVPMLSADSIREATETT
ncbi:MAG: hypothetical protein JHC79_22855 [Williamsia sp.]|nr:hypothetical protein [Williamsia sp.]